MTGGAENQGLIVFGAERGKRDAGFVSREINQHISFLNNPAQFVSDVNPAGNGQPGNLFRSPEKRVAHFAFCPGDDDSGHDLRTPH